jgi:hypothetical protein
MFSTLGAIVGTIVGVFGFAAMLTDILNGKPPRRWPF